MFIQSVNSILAVIANIIFGPFAAENFSNEPSSFVTSVCPHVKVREPLKAF